MKNTSYTLIQDWMYDLGLSVSELLAFAVIFGFSQDGESKFSGSRSYLAKKICAKSRATVDKALAGLLEKGFIVKFESVQNGVKFCSYAVDMAAVPSFIGQVDCAPCPENEQGGAQKLGTKIKNKEKVSPTLIAHEVGIEWENDESYELLATLCSEPKWRTKSENALRLSFRKLAAVPEIVAAEMMRKAIANGWQGLYDLHDDEIARLYGKPSNSQQRAERAPRAGGVSASEAIVAAAMAQFNQ